jgi:hypothetical protein
MVQTMVPPPHFASPTTSTTNQFVAVAGTTNRFVVCELSPQTFVGCVSMHHEPVRGVVYELLPQTGS